MTNEQLQAWFKQCEEWQDPEQWEWLALAYYERGYMLNALHCFRRADACRVVVAVETEPAYATNL